MVKLPGKVVFPGHDQKQQMTGLMLVGAAKAVISTGANRRLATLDAYKGFEKAPAYFWGLGNYVRTCICSGKTWGKKGLGPSPLAGLETCTKSKTRS